MDKDKKRLAKYLGVFLGVCSVFMVGVFVGKMDWSSQIQSVANNKYTLTGDIKQEYQGVNVNILWETWSELEKEYIKSDLDAQKMVYGATKGLVESLDDPYTAFLSPQETADYKQTNAGEYEGIGATLKQEEGAVAIESPIDNSPAQRAGLKAGDYILKVDDKDVEESSVYEVVALIRGKAGTEVKLHIYRASDKKEYDFTITRASIDIDNISVEKLDNGIVKIKIVRFTETDLATFNSLWDEMVEKTLSYNPKGIVIDLRNNPGGYVSGVENVISEFVLKDKTIFWEESKNGAKVEHTVSRDGKLLNVPVVVLVNQGSASASEIFAGAMQDLGRAKVIGMPTVGKGVEQKILTLSDGSMLQVVFQKWLTPSGKNITKTEPIKPDFEIDDPKAQEDKALELLK